MLPFPFYFEEPLLPDQMQLFRGQHLLPPLIPDILGFLNHRFTSLLLFSTQIIVGLEFDIFDFFFFNVRIMLTRK